MSGGGLKTSHSLKDPLVLLLRAMSKRKMEEGASQSSGEQFKGDMFFSNMLQFGLF